jgi:predicted transcriptional regulator
MSLGTNKELAQNKLILLYIINAVNMPVSNLQITKLILENKFMNYFLFQQFLNELCDNAYLLSETSNGKVFYTITSSGKQTLEYFTSHIPVEIKNKIDSNILSIKTNIRNETYIKADYTLKSENEFIVSCQVREDNFSLIDLNITVGSKSDARTICDNWKKHAQSIYSEIIESLLKNRE